MKAAHMKASHMRRHLRGARVMLALIVALATAPIGVVAQGIAADPLPPEKTPLQPGRYFSTAAGPRIEFRVGDGWATDLLPDGPIFTLTRTDQPGTVLTVTIFDGAVFTDSCDPASLTEVDASAARLAVVIAGNPFLNPAPPVQTDVDGFSAISLDVATPTFAATDCALPELLIWAIPMKDGEFVQVANQQSRFVIVDVDGTVIVISIETFPGVPFGSFLEQSMDLVRSMRIEPAPAETASPVPSPLGENPSPSPTPQVASGAAAT